MAMAMAGLANALVGDVMLMDTKKNANAFPSQMQTELLLRLPGRMALGNATSSSI
jgi:hypothetical protein